MDHRIPKSLPEAPLPTSPQTSQASQPTVIPSSVVQELIGKRTTNESRNEATLMDVLERRLLPSLNEIEKEHISLKQQVATLAPKLTETENAIASLKQQGDDRQRVNALFVQHIVKLENALREAKQPVPSRDSRIQQYFSAAEDKGAHPAPLTARRALPPVPIGQRVLEPAKRRDIVSVTQLANDVDALGALLSEAATAQVSMASGQPDEPGSQPRASRKDSDASKGLLQSLSREKQPLSPPMSPRRIEEEGMVHEWPVKAEQANEEGAAQEVATVKVARTKVPVSPRNSPSSAPADRADLLRTPSKSVPPVPVLNLSVLSSSPDVGRTPTASFAAESTRPSTPILPRTKATKHVRTESTLPAHHVGSPEPTGAEPNVVSPRSVRSKTSLAGWWPRGAAPEEKGAEKSEPLQQKSLLAREIQAMRLSVNRTDIVTLNTSEKWVTGLAELLKDRHIEAHPEKMVSALQWVLFAVHGNQPLNPAFTAEHEASLKRLANDWNDLTIHKLPAPLGFSAYRWKALNRIMAGIRTAL